MLSVIFSQYIRYIFSQYIRYTTILAYCTDIRVISVFLYAVHRRGIEPGPPECTSEGLPTELCGLLSITLFKDVEDVELPDARL